jgi:hypothetical protein
MEKNFHLMHISSKYANICTHVIKLNGLDQEKNGGEGRHTNEKLFQFIYKNLYGDCDLFLGLSF